MPKDEIFNRLDNNQILDVFAEMFYKELDSWFSADIACCDSCYDEFISKWPAANSRSYIFQRNMISVKEFYSGSELSRFFTMEDFNRYIVHINCPN